jgi:hypothetical protein
MPGQAQAEAPRDGLSWKEGGLALLGLVVLAAVAYLPHIRHGGFYLDDWSDAAGTFHPPGGPGIGNVLDYFGPIFPYRPVLILYVPFKYALLGANMAAQLTLAVALGVAVAALLYGLLRHFRVPPLHAWAIAALVVVYPSFDSVRLWEAASLPSVALIFALSGIWLALIALERRSWPLHACAALLYVISILTYEITLPLIAGAGLLYVADAGWRRARAPWGLGIAAVLVAGLWNGLHTNREVSGLSGDLHHLKEIFDSGATVLGSTLIPVGATPRTTLALVVLAAVLAAGAAAYLAAPSRWRDPGWGLREWLFLAAAGLAVAALGWIMFIPADPYYTPSLLGYTNRVNAVSGLGLVICVYAALGVGVTLLAALVPRLRPWSAWAILGLAVLLGASYVHVLERHIDIWDEAYRQQRVAIDRIKAVYPDLPPESTLFTSAYPAYYTLGVPIFSANWDLNGMVKMEYDDGSLEGYPLFEGSSLECRPDGIAMSGAVESRDVTPYGDAHLLNLQTQRHSTPRDRRQCEAEIANYPPGPLYVMYAY